MPERSIMAKKGFIARMFEGPERSESYARSTLPTSRWSLGWDVFKTNMSKLFGLNLLTLLFLLPTVAIFVIRYMMKTYDVANYPFAQNFGVGYPVFPSTVGLAEQLELSLNLYIFRFLPIGVVIAAVGFSGGFYVMRNLVWAEGVSVASDFWKGVKQNFFVVLFSLLLYAVIMAVSVLSLNMSSVMIATHAGKDWLFVIAKVVTVLVMVIATMMVLYMLTIGVTYKLKFWQLVRNSFILSIALFPTNIFFALFAAVFFFLCAFGVQLLTMLGVILICVWGVSVFMLIWTDYSNWVFDKFINDKVPGAKKNRGIYRQEKTAEGDKEEVLIGKSKLKERPVKPITDYDVELYELPTSFSRKDLEKLEETKEAMRRDSDRYAEEHLRDGDVKTETFEDLLAEEEKRTCKKQAADENDGGTPDESGEDKKDE